MKPSPSSRRHPLFAHPSSVAVSLALLAAVLAGFPTAAKAHPASVQTFDRITYTEPQGFEPAPMGASNHVSFRRVDPASWILFSIYAGRVRSRHLGAEFKFDWNDLNNASGIAAPASVARKVAQGIDAREGGVYVPNVGYVDLVEVDVGDRVVAIIIECGSEDQFRSYQRIIGPFLDNLVVQSGPKYEPDATGAGAPPVSPPGANPTPATTREVDYVNDGFVWKGADGLEHVPALTTVASGSGFPATIPGVWQDDRQQFTLELAEDGTYASVWGAGNSSGTLLIRESGRWKADGTKLALSPQSASRYTRNYRDYHGGETAAVDCGGPRIYEVTTLVLEYRWNNALSRTDGIEIKGPPAPWYYTGGGNFSIVLRRTGDRRAK